MPNLTRWSLYELEQIAKRKGYDIDRLRNAYWDEMVGGGQAGTGVRREALKSRVFEEPIEAPEHKIPWYEKMLAPAGSQREAGLESFAANWPRLLAGAAETPADLLAASGRAVSGIPGVGEPAEELLAGSGELIQDEIRRLREMSEQAPVSRPESAAMKAGAVGSEIGGELARFAPYLMAGGPIAGFAGAEAVPAYAGGEPIGHVITEGAKGAALGAGFEAASMLPLIYRLPAMAGVSGALPALEGAGAGEIATAAGLGGVLGALGPRKPARFKERVRRPPQSQIVEEPVSVSAEEEALAALKSERPMPPGPPPPAAPARAVEPPIRTEMDLIERQRNTDLARRASASGRSVEEQAAFETRQGAERAELDAAELEGRPPKIPAAPEPTRELPTPPTEAAPPKPPEGERGFIRLDALLGSKTNPIAEAKAVDAAISSAGHAPPSRPYQDRVDKVRGGITDLLDSLGFRATTWAEHAAEIEAKGTLPKAARKPFREAHETELGGEPPTGWYEFQTSPKSVLEARDKALELKKELDALLADAHRNGDVLTLRAAKEIGRKFNAKVEQVNLMRKSQGEGVRIWQQTSKEAMEWALINDGIKAIAARPPRMPLYTNIKKNVLKLVNERKDLSSNQRKELGEQLLRDAVDAWRLNLFSVTSFTLDLIGNLAASVSEGAGLLGEDVGLGVYRLMKGEPQAMGLRSMLQGMKKIGKPAPAEVEKALGLQTASGEVVSGFGGVGRAGTFTTRSKPTSAIIDNVVGAPLYMKGAVDTGFKRMGAWAALYRKAASEANKLPKSQRAEWIRTRVETMKPEEIAEVVEQANKVGFNRQLTGVEESIAASPIFKLAFGAFPRWPFQFTRALGEWIGVNPKAFRQIARGPNRGQALTNYLGKTAAGIGGLYLINDTLYDNVDFKSMEYVHENGNRTRLSGREPLPTVLALSAGFKGDWENAKNALKYTSLPGASIVSGEGGLLWTLVQRIQQAAQRREFDAKSVEKEAIKMLNKMIPGQALLAAVKSVFDPISREGIGADIPGVSMALPAKIDPTTGKPLEQYQKIPAIGATIPQVSGVPIPGAQRIVDPVSQLLGSYGMMDYRMPRRPIAGVPSSQIPPESQRRWYELLGEERTKIFKTMAPALLAKRKDIPYNTRLDLMNKYQVFERLEKGGVSRQEAAEKAFGEAWKQDLLLAMKLNEDKELIQKKDSFAAKRAMTKLEQELRRARRERRL